jgi:pimeloyl-ACP methyl ester carboxylesterase
MAYVDVNGLSLGYEEHGAKGDGPALVLLHGGLGSGDMFEPVLPALTKNRRVLTVDLQGNGRTADIDRPFSYEAMADDVAAFIDLLDLARADVMGYSLGGEVAFQVAVRHPASLRRLVLVGAPCKHEAYFPEVIAAMRQMGPESAEMMKKYNAPPYEAYARVAPRVEDWPTLVTKTGRLVSSEYDWTDLARTIAAPTLLAFADADSISTAHMAEFYGLLGGGQRDAGWEGSDLPPRPVHQLAVLPGTTHYDVFMAPALLDAVNTFLAAP